MSRLCELGWSGDVAPRSRRRTNPPVMRRLGRRERAASLLDPLAAHEAYGRELAGLVDAVLAGDLVVDRVSVERQVVQALGVLMWLQQRHQVDDRSRCLVCRQARRAWWPWPRRSACTVHAALSVHLRQPGRFVLSAITGNADTGRDAS
ncbi:MAG: hypothetical protein ACRDTG_16135 [Pseudonocardiaceae bacterium]